MNVELTDRIARESPEVYGPLLADSAREFGDYTDEQLQLIADFVHRERRLLATHTARLRERLRPGDTRHEAAATTGTDRLSLPEGEPASDPADATRAATATSRVRRTMASAAVPTSSAKGTFGP